MLRIALTLGLWSMGGPELKRAPVVTGTTTHLSLSLLYAPPEAVIALEAGQKTTSADPAADMWALGVIAYELLTARRAFPRSLNAEDIRAQIIGRKALPWETPDLRKKRVPELRMLRRSVLTCLSRDPIKRPTSAELLQSWNNLFDHATKGTVTQELESQPSELDAMSSLG
jgi:serine/threonine protein kinase